MLRIEGLKYVISRVEATAMLLKNPNSSVGRMASGPAPSGRIIHVTFFPMDSSKYTASYADLAAPTTTTFLTESACKALNDEPNSFEWMMGTETLSFLKCGMLGIEVTPVATMSLSLFTVSVEFSKLRLHPKLHLSARRTRALNRMRRRRSWSSAYFCK